MRSRAHRVCFAPRAPRTEVDVASATDDNAADGGRLAIIIKNMIETRQ